MDVTKFDKNLKVKNQIDRDDVMWLDAAQEPFVIYGASSCNPYVRIPEDVAEQVSDIILYPNTHTAGVRARFRTDSPYIAIHVEWNAQTKFPHMPSIGTSGFDLYMVNNGCQFFVDPAFMPPFEDSPNGYESIAFVHGEMQDYVLNFPLYNDVKKLYIGVQKDSHFEKPGTYFNQKPVVFYGSSITQGGCASRPGTCYQNVLSRRLNMDYINLGFSGCAQGEAAMMEYIAGLDMSVFVCDYDHNAPNAEHLAQTHYRLYEKIRQAHPQLPYVMISKPDFYHHYVEMSAGNVARRNVIQQSFHRAIAAGDTNVYYIDGASIFNGEDDDSCTVDGCHPNDLGFHRFAQALLPVLRRLLC